MTRNAYRYVKQIKPAPLILGGTGKGRREREAVRKQGWKCSPFILCCLATEMKEQNWRQSEDYPTAPLPYVADSCFNMGTSRLPFTLTALQRLAGEEQVYQQLLCSEQLFLVLTNSHKTTQLSTTYESVLPDMNVPLTQTFSVLLISAGSRDSSNCFHHHTWYFSTFFC